MPRSKTACVDFGRGLRTIWTQVAGADGGLVAKSSANARSGVHLSPGTPLDWRRADFDPGDRVTAVTKLRHCPSHRAVDDSGVTGAILCVERPAFVVCRSEGILRANEAGAMLLERRPYITIRDVQTSMSGRGPRPFRVMNIEASGGEHCIAVLEKKAAFDLRVDLIAAHFGFSERQRVVFGLLARGCCNKTIAAKTGCTAGTIELHVTAILGKTGFNHRTELIASFYDTDWPEL